MNTVFRDRIRKLGIKKTIFLSIFTLTVLAYIAVPLITLACGGNNNGGGNGNSSSNGNGNGNNNNGNGNGNNNNGNGNGNGNNNNNNNNSNSNQKIQAKPSPKAIPTQAAQGKSRFIDAGIFLVSTQKGPQQISKSDIRSIRVVMPITQLTKNPPALTLSEYKILLQDTPLTGSTPVQVEVLLTDQPTQRVLTKGLFVAKEIGGQRVGALIVTTQDQQKILADQFASVQNDPFAKNITGPFAKLRLQVPTQTV